MSTPTLSPGMEVEPQQARPGRSARPEQPAQGGAVFARLLAGPAAAEGGPGDPAGPEDPASAGATPEPGEDTAPALLAPTGTQAAQQALPEALEVPLQRLLTAPEPVAAPASIALAARAPELAEILRATAATDTRTAPDGSGSLSRLLGILQVLHGVAPGMAVAAPGDRAPAASAATLMQALGVAEAAADAAGAGRAQVEASAARAAEAALSMLGPGGTAPASSSVAAGGMPTVSVSVPAGGPDWAEALGQRVLWMVRGKVQTAELRLNPPDLGAVEVRVRLEEDGLRLSFNAATAGARDALEQAAPRLREALEAEGFSLSGFDVDRHGADDSTEEEMTTAGDGDPAQLVEDGEESFLAQPLAAGGRGLVDTFV
ncbi:flagellar hook-length control protein FliK [Thioalkalivibrio sp. XN279]|uniref:flagellar hook-length control protein FliK n=1 Tax=Thioalkalivibrio sp. XN279 TaxID=2714953 RepID=UPI001407E2F0|nr:flagellar hook-length control protein FliK [Thioalkalivibrio sp. XN279]NHA13363.1 hypothetical protein [Thioalkalivibrio sp. XN279]